MNLLPGFIVPNIHFFGLSIDRTTIHAVELSPQGAVRTYAEVAIDENTFADATLVKKESFIQALKALVSQGRFSTTYVSVCFPEAYAYTRDHSVPDMEKEDIDEAVAWKVKDLFPLPEDDIYYDWKRLDEKDGQVHIGVVGIQKKTLDSLVDAIIASGLKPLRFEPDASAVARLIGLKPQQYGLVTEVNKRSASVTLVEGEKSLFTTVVTYGKTDTPVAFLENITASLEDIAKYYTNKGMLRKDNTKVIVTGEIGSREWADYMAKRVAYPIEILSTPVGNSAYNKAYASAAETMSPPQDDSSINLMPRDVQEIYDESWRISYVQSLAVRSLVGLLVICCIPFVVLISVLTQKEKLVKESAVLQSIIKSQDASIGQVTILNGKLESILALAPLKKTPASHLAQLAALTPSGIHISQLEYDDSKQLYTISGTSSDRTTLLAFRNVLESSKKFTKIVLPLSSLESEANSDFSMSFVGVSSL